jgi:hypothetical protein
MSKCQVANELAAEYEEPLETAMIDCKSTVFRLPGCLCCALLCCVGSLAVAGSAEDWEQMKKITPHGYVCGFTEKPLVIDGRIDKAAWQAAPWTEDFVDIEGSRKPQPRFRTRAKMLWDNDYLYIAAELEEPHVLGTVTKHDAVIFEDNDFEVFINPDGNNHNYYELELNALNTTWDLYMSRPYKDGGKADDSFEFTGMKTAVRVKGTLNNPADKDEGWCVEIAIPWKALGQHARRPAPPKNGDQWRIDFSRVEWKYEIVGGKYIKVPNTHEDNWVWSPQGIVDMHRPERWGYVQFSNEAPGKGTFVPDPTLRGRDLLMEVYHRQKSFHEQHGRWATTLHELGMMPPATNNFTKPLELKTTDDGFQATLEVSIGKGATRRLCVCQDSRLSVVAPDDPLKNALDRAGKNREQIQKALDDAPADQREAIQFLVSNMPNRDLRELSADFLLENVRFAYQAWNESPWKNAVPQDVFFNDVLPYASINERRDRWRKDFYEQLRPLIKNAKTPGEAATILNQRIFPLLKVRYSTKRPKADQSPSESIQAGLASCTGLSVILIDGCRAVGVPARFVGTFWSDNSGNHSWTEIWDQGWHFTGAAEPTGDKLDQSWFVGKAAAAQRDNPWYAIYSVSYRRTPLKFPCDWDRSIDYVYAVNVTDRYHNGSPKQPVGTVLASFRALDAPGGSRCAASLKIIDATGKKVFEGTTKDETFDANDHLATFLPAGQEYQVEIHHAGYELKTHFKSEPRNAPYTWYIQSRSEKH